MLKNQQRFIYLEVFSKIGHLPSSSSTHLAVKLRKDIWTEYLPYKKFNCFIKFPDLNISAS